MTCHHDITTCGTWLIAPIQDILADFLNKLAGAGKQDIPRNDKHRIRQ